ncbi:hypothetical protein RJ55_03337 [Drechmeria coniospora]|nr:hypothetical protein RJ55_03337 [Drechmeria coniospora]
MTTKSDSYEKLNRDGCVPSWWCSEDSYMRCVYSLISKGAVASQIADTRRLQIWRVLWLTTVTIIRTERLIVVTTSLPAGRATGMASSKAKLEDRVRAKRRGWLAAMPAVAPRSINQAGEVRKRKRSCCCEELEVDATAGNRPLRQSPHVACARERAPLMFAELPFLILKLTALKGKPRNGKFLHVGPVLRSRTDLSRGQGHYVVADGASFENSPQAPSKIMARTRDSVMLAAFFFASSGRCFLPLVGGQSLGRPMGAQEMALWL